MPTRKSLAMRTSLIAIIIASAASQTLGSAMAAAATSSRTSAKTAMDSGTLEEIVVTAQKREENISKVGMSITALSGDDLVQRGVTNVGDLAKVVPGFTYTPTQFNAPVYTIRGIGFYETTLAATPAVTVYTDEIPLPFASMTKAAALDLERVEVLKGPQGTLFGQNSTGGAINYVAAKPTNELKAGIDASYGRFNAIDAQGFLSGPLADTLKGRLAVRFLHSDAWQYSYTRNDKNGKNREIDGRLLLDWQPSDRLNINLNANGWHNTGETQAPQLIAITPQVPAAMLPAVTNYPLAPNKARAADWTPGFPDRNDSFYQFSLRGDYDLTDAVKLTSITAYQHYKTRSRNDWDGMDNDNGDIGAIGHINSFVQEVRLSGNNAPVLWTVGGNYERDTTYDELQYFVGTGSSNSPIPGLRFLRSNASDRQNMSTYAVFGNLEYQLTDALKLHGGARYTDSKRSFSGCTNTGTGALYDANIGTTFSIFSSLFTGGAPPVIGPGDCITLDATTFLPGLVRKNLNQHNVSWRTGLDWQAASNALLYANVSRGYKSGGFPTLAAASSAVLEPVPQESVLAYEAGFKSTVADRRLRLNGAAFYYDYTNKQLRGKTLAGVFGVLEGLVTVPKSRVWGLEGQIGATPIHGLDINLGATHLDSKVQRFTGIGSTGLSANFAGNEFPFTPKYQVNGDIQYSWNLPNGLSPYIGAGLVYNSATNASIGNEALTRIDSYTVVDLRVGVAGEKWRAGLWARNLFNKFYWTNVSRANDTVVRFAGQPATFGGSISYRF